MVSIPLLTLMLALSLAADKTGTCAGLLHENSAQFFFQHHSGCTLFPTGDGAAVGSAFSRAAFRV